MWRETYNFCALDVTAVNLQVKKMKVLFEIQGEIMDAVKKIVVQLRDFLLGFKQVQSLQIGDTKIDCKVLFGRIYITKKEKLLSILDVAGKIQRLEEATQKELIKLSNRIFELEQAGKKKLPKKK